MISAPRGKHARHHHNPQDQGMVLTIPRPTSREFVARRFCGSFSLSPSHPYWLQNCLVKTKRGTQRPVISPQLLALQDCHFVPQDVHA